MQLSQNEAASTRRWQVHGGNREHVARAFYEGALGGRQVWPTGQRAPSRRLWFLVDSSLVGVGLVDGDVERCKLAVDSPAAIAERCWDAGYTIRLRSEDGDDLIVVDPFGREIVLMPRDSAVSLGMEAAG